MKVDLVYPSVGKRKRNASAFRSAARWTFLITAYASLAANLCAGGKAWSVVVLWSLWFLWAFLFSPDLVEYNRISQTSKFLAYSCVLLVCIDVLLSPGWAAFVVPLICFGGLLVIAVLFFSDLEKQRRNSMPMLWLIFASILSILASFLGWPETSWPMLALGATAFGLLLLCVAVLGNSLLVELKKRFHTD